MDKWQPSPASYEFDKLLKAFNVSPNELMFGEEKYEDENKPTYQKAIVKVIGQ